MGNALRKAVTVAGLVLTALAIYDQLVRDPRYRNWYGSVFGVPYDFRRPTSERVRAKLWAPDDPRIFTPHVFGVGWALNAGRIIALLRSASGR